MSTGAFMLCPAMSTSLETIIALNRDGMNTLTVCPRGALSSCAVSHRVCLSLSTSKYGSIENRPSHASLGRLGWLNGVELSYLGRPSTSSTSSTTSCRPGSPASPQALAELIQRAACACLLVMERQHSGFLASPSHSSYAFNLPYNL